MLVTTSVGDILSENLTLPGDAIREPEAKPLPDNFGSHSTHLVEGGFMILFVEERAVYLVRGNPAPTILQRQDTIHSRREQDRVHGEVSARLEVLDRAFQSLSAHLFLR